jgi:uncharacterized protein YggU (UPF0235/DUF167 family)
MITESLLTIHVRPRSSRNRHELQEDGSVTIWLSAPPVDGAANKALLAYLADLLDVPKTSIQIVLGQTSTTKRLRVPLAIDELRSRLRGST